MSHLDPSRPATRAELRSFGLLVGGAFAGLAAIITWKRGALATPLPLSFASVGVLLAATGLAAPRLLGSVYAGWMRFAVLLSRVTTPVFMGVIYFVVLTPLGLVLRAVGRNPLRVRGQESLWVTRPPGARASTLERQF